MGATPLVVEPQTPPALDITELHNLQHNENSPSAAAEPAGNHSSSSPTSTKQILSLLALFATLFISALNATIVATAIPTIVHEFNSPAGYAWISAAYLLGTTASSPIWAKLSDIWGRKPILLIAVATYCGFSMVCALATSMTMLIVGRALQGVTGGGLICLVTIVISDMFSMRKRGLYMAMTEIVWTLAAGTGPVLGGLFAQHLSWRWIFWIVLPICFIAFMLILFALDVHNPRTPLLPGLKAIDWAGSITIIGLLVMFLLGLNFGGAEYAWNSSTVICLIVFGLLMTVVFVFCEKKLSKYPLIPMSIFMDKSNIAIMFVGFAKNFALIALDFYFPLFFQAVRNASPTISGCLILPANLTTCLSAFLAGVFMTKTGRYIDLLYGGTVLLALGFGLFILWGPNSTLGETIAFQIFAGLGLGALISPTYVALQANVPPSMTATSTASLGMVKNVAAVISIVAGHTIFQNGMDQQNPGLIASGVPSNIATLINGQNAAANLDVINTIQDGQIRYLVQNAFAAALRNIWIMITALSAAAVLSTLLIKKTKLSDQHVEAKTGLEKQPDIV